MVLGERDATEACLSAVSQQRANFARHCLDLLKVQTVVGARRRPYTDQNDVRCDPRQVGIGRRTQSATVHRLGDEVVQPWLADRRLARGETCNEARIGVDREDLVARGSKGRQP